MSSFKQPQSSKNSRTTNSAPNEEIISKIVYSLPSYEMEAMGIGQQALMLDGLLETLPMAIRKFDDLQNTVARARKEKAVLDDEVCELKRRISDLEGKKTATRGALWINEELLRDAEGQEQIVNEAIQSGKREREKIERGLRSAFTNFRRWRL
jgi:chromosome segregation ATPase